jgi:hypothetical protein
VTDDREIRMRASDGEREEVVTILREALQDGRLKMDEYVDRMGKAYEAVTIGDLALLHDDLPAAKGTVARATPATEPLASLGAPQTAPPPSSGWHEAFNDLPAVLKVLWTIWFMAVSINVVVWVLVGVTSATVPYPWPLWVAGPYGAALFGVSMPVLKARRAKRARLPRQGS